MRTVAARTVELELLLLNKCMWYRLLQTIWHYLVVLWCLVYHAEALQFLPAQSSDIVHMLSELTGAHKR